MKRSDEWKKEREHIIHIMHNSSRTDFWELTCCRHLKGVLAEEEGTGSQSHHGGQSASLLDELISLWRATVYTEVGIHSRHVTSIVNRPFLKEGLPPVVSFSRSSFHFSTRMVYPYP